MSRTTVERAKVLAHRAHAGQVDKAGRPYIEHVARVAAAVADDLDAEAVAWGHDIIEDCEPGFAAELLQLLPADLGDAVLVLTRFDWMPEEDYYAEIRANPIALRVKMADIDDNSDERRLALLKPEKAARLRCKYAHARAELGAADA